MLYLSPRNEELLARPPLPCENDMVVKSSATLHRTVLLPVHIKGQRNSSSGIQPGADNKRILASRYFATFPGQIFRHLPRRNVTISTLGHSLDQFHSYRVQPISQQSLHFSTHLFIHYRLSSSWELGSDKPK